MVKFEIVIETVPSIWYVALIVIIFMTIATLYYSFKQDDEWWYHMLLMYVGFVCGGMLRASDNFFTALASVDYPVQSIVHSLLWIVLVLSVALNIYSAFKKRPKNT